MSTACVRPQVEEVRLTWTHVDRGRMRQKPDCGSHKWMIHYSIGNGEVWPT